MEYRLHHQLVRALFLICVMLCCLSVVFFVDKYHVALPKSESVYMDMYDYSKAEEVNEKLKDNWKIISVEIDGCYGLTLEMEK